MCDFCENILDENSEDGLDRNHIFVRKDGSYWIFAETGDGFCVGNVPNIKFCPMCGRKLSEEKHSDPLRQTIKEVAEEMPALGEYDGDYAFHCGTFGYFEDGYYKIDFSCSNCGKRHEGVIWGVDVTCTCGKIIKT